MKKSLAALVAGLLLQSSVAAYAGPITDDIVALLNRHHSLALGLSSTGSRPPSGSGRPSSGSSGMGMGSATRTVSAPPSRVSAPAPVYRAPAPPAPVYRAPTPTTRTTVPTTYPRTTVPTTYPSTTYPGAQRTTLPSTTRTTMPESTTRIPTVPTTGLPGRRDSMPPATIPTVKTGTGNSNSKPRVTTYPGRATPYTTSPENNPYVKSGSKTAGPKPPTGTVRRPVRTTPPARQGQQPIKPGRQPIGVKPAPGRQTGASARTQPKAPIKLPPSAKVGPGGKALPPLPSKQVRAQTAQAAQSLARQMPPQRMQQNFQKALGGDWKRQMAMPKTAQQMSVVKNVVVNKTVINNYNVYNNRYGWYNWGGYRCWHPNWGWWGWGGGWWGWNFGGWWFWTTWYSGYCWHYDPWTGRWVYFYNGYWLYPTPAVVYVYVNNGSDQGSYVQYQQNDNGSAVAQTDPAAGESADKTYYSPDGSRKVVVFADDGQGHQQSAFLYDASDKPAFDPVWLGANVANVVWNWDAPCGKTAYVAAIQANGDGYAFDANGYALPQGCSPKSAQTGLQQSPAMQQLQK